MVVAIQKYLHIIKIMWRLVDSVEFIDLQTVLDNVMQERAAMNVGVTKRQAKVITYKTEQELWEKGLLGEDSPDKLRDTVLFLLGVNLYLRAIEDHYNLRRTTPLEKSQISFEQSESGQECLVYREDSVTKTHDGGLNDMRKERKIAWIFPSQDILRCPVRLTKKYLALCPPFFAKNNFYLKALTKTRPSQWYANQVVGQNTLGKVVKELMNAVEIEGFFTNHSLRRTGSTRLFQAGVDRKLIKEATGHTSDAVDAYQVTSDQQREAMSKIIAGPKAPEQVLESDKSNSIANKEAKSDLNVDLSLGSSRECSCNARKVGTVIDQIVNSVSRKGKSVVKISIEIHNE